MTSMFIAVFFFSIMEVIVKYNSNLPTIQLVFFRTIVGLVLSFTYLKYWKIPVFGNHKKLLVFRGIFGTLALIIYFYTLQIMPLATAVILQKLNPLFVLLISWIVYKEKISKLQWVFFLIATLGIFMVKGFDPRISLTAFSLGILGALCTAGSYTSISKIQNKEHPMVIIFYFPLVTLPCISYFVWRDWVSLTLNQLFLLTTLGLVVQIAQYFLTRSLQENDSSRVSIALYSGTIFSVINGYLFFDEPLTFWLMVGILLILFATLGNVLFKKRGASASLINAP